MGMTHLLRTAAIAAIIAGASSPGASAATFNGVFNLGGTSFGEPGLVMATSAPSGAFSFDLDTAGQSVTFDLFDIWAAEASASGNNTQTSTLQAGFTFAGIGAAGSTTGNTRGHNAFFIHYASVTWGGPALLSFGNGGLLSIALGNATFSGGFFGLAQGQGNGATIQATATLVSESLPPTPVPLPASGLVLLGALGGAGAILRRRRRAG